MQRWEHARILVSFLERMAHVVEGCPRAHDLHEHERQTTSDRRCARTYPMPIDHVNDDDSVNTRERTWQFADMPRVLCEPTHVSPNTAADNCILTDLPEVVRDNRARDPAPKRECFGNGRST